MKWVGGTIAGVFLGFFFIVIFIFYKSGSFKKVEIEKASVGPFIAIYKERLGPYHESSKTLIEVEDILKANQLLCVKSFGIYIDDPNNTDAERLRSELGCLFAEKYKDQLQQIATTSNLNIKYLDKKNYIIGKFEGSPALVSLKVYPKLKDWAETQRYKTKPEILEIYEVKSSDQVKTSVLFEIEE